MLLAFLTALAIAGAPSVGADSDLAGRFALASTPGVRFIPALGTTVSKTVNRQGQGVLEPSCSQRAAGLCEINWASAPQAFSPLPLPDAWQAALATGKARVLLASEVNLPLIVYAKGEVLLAFELSAESVSSPGARLRRWPYFNYLLHVAACAATEVTPPHFGNWAHSPLPTPRTRLLILGGLGLFWLLIFALYRLARSRGSCAPSAGPRFLAAVAALRNRPVSSALPKRLEASSDPPGQPTAPEATAAFARPLSGLLMLLGGMVLLTGPYFAMQSLITRHVQPFPEADGLWRTTSDALYIVWMTFDMGTQTAFVKYFAEHRIKEPERAVHDVQFYVWFQIFSRLVQATLLVAFALGYMPGSAYALYAPFVLLYAAVSQPAFPAVGKFLCQAIQRFDYYNLLDFLESRLLGFLVPLPFILLGRAWGRQNPEFGEAYGAALGMGIGGLATALSVLFIGLYALHRLRLPLGPLFLAQFGKETARRQLWYGFKLTLGQEPFRLTSFLESLILIRWLRDSPTWLGLRDLLHNRLIMLAYLISWGYYQSAVPVVSEALAVGKRQLVQYFVARYLQFGALFSAAILSLLCAVGPVYILRALGAQWGQAADYLFIAALCGPILPWAWLTDSLQQGAGRPGTTTVVMLVEQGARLVLLLVLIQRFQFLSIYMASLIALLLKVVLAWTINHRSIVPLRLPLWTGVGAPYLAALLNYLLWRGVVQVLAPTSVTAVLVLFLCAGAGSIGLCFFLVGLLGGLDAVARTELDQAWRKVALIGPLCRGLVLCAELGARIFTQLFGRLWPGLPQPPPGWQVAQKESADLESAAMEPLSASGRIPPANGS